MTSKNIVIVGGGYAGLLVAKKLQKNLLSSKHQITIIDQEAYQLFTFNLYEVATAEEEFTSISGLKQAISLPLTKILNLRKIDFLQSRVKEINLAQKIVKAGSKTINFDYLVLAPGSEGDYYGIEGAKEHALPLKTLKDALILRNRIEFSFFAHSLDMTKKNLRFVVAGGGYTGCEIAAELANLIEILCWKYNYPPQKVEIQIIESASELICGFSKKLSEDALERLKALGVKVQLSSFIYKVGPQFAELLSGDKIGYDALVWSVGVRARQLPIQEALAVDKKGRLGVNEHLQLKEFNNVFVLGDAAYVMDKKGNIAVPSAQDAIDQAEYLAKALPQILVNKKPESYEVLKHGFIVTLGGRWSIMDYNGVYLKGFFAYIIRELAHIRYLAKLMNWYKAIKFVWFQNNIFSRND